MSSRKKRAIIFSYAHFKDGQFTKLGGPALALRDFIVSQNWDLLCVWQPLPISTTVSLIVEKYIEGRRIFLKRIFFPDFCLDRKKDFSFLYFWLKVRDLFSFFVPIIYSREADVFWGVESLNAILGLVIKKLRIIKKVIYYNLDYGDQRFENGMMNQAFHFLDKAASKNCDYTWNLSAEMSTARKRRGYDRGRFSKQITVPIGIDYSRVAPLRRENSDPKKLVFLGVLSQNTGAELLIDILLSVQRKHPGATLAIVGGGPTRVFLEAEVRSKNVIGVQFEGVLLDSEVEKVLCQGGVGLAPYKIDSASIKHYTDVTKPKMYINCGLPVIITEGTPTAKVIEEAGAGVIAGFSAESFAEKIISLIGDPAEYQRLKSGAVKLASTLEWSTVFKKALVESEIE